MEKEKDIPEQHQSRQPGIEAEMKPQPDSTVEEYKGSGKLNSKVAIITGGDSGIGRAVAVAFAKEGADVVVVYLNEHGDANDTKKEVEQCGRRCVLITGDVGNEEFCAEVAAKTLSEFGHVEILVNAVAPGPIWTPLIPSTFPPEKVGKFGKDVPMKRPGQPDEVAPCYVFLASKDCSYISGQVLHPNGGEIVNG